MALTNIDIARGAFAITPSDSADLLVPANGLYIGTSAPGTLKVTCADGSVVTFGAIIAGAIIPLSVTRVFSTGTTVSNIIGFK